MAWSRVDGEGVVEVEEASMISRAVRVSEVGVARVGVCVPLGLWRGRAYTKCRNMGNEGHVIN